MTIHLNTHPDDRKDMVKAISGRTGLDAAYIGPPSFAYQVGAVTVNRDGTIDYEQDPSMDGVIPLLIERGWLDPGEYDLGAGEDDASAEQISKQPADVTAVAIRLPLEGWTVQEAKNLLRLVCSKQYLIRRMTGNDDLYLSSAFTNAISAKTDHESIADIQEDLKAGMERGEVAGVSFADDTFMMAFPYDAQDSTRWEAIGELMRGMMRMAKAATRVSLDTRVTEENEKYYARSWLVRMGYGGPEHKELRATLLDHLKGYAAFKSEADMQAHKDKYAALRRERRDTDPVRRDNDD